MTWVKNKTTKLTIMSIKIGIGKLRIGTGGGKSWASYWSTLTDGVTTVRAYVEDDYFKKDITLTPLGFDGDVDTDWENVESTKLYAGLPTGLTLTGVSGGVKIDWIADPDDQVEIWGKSDNGEYALIYTIAAGTYTQTQLMSPVDLRYYKLRGKNGVFYSEFTEEASIALLGANLITNGGTPETTDWVDTNSDGIPDGWTESAANITTIVTGGSFVGNAVRIDGILSNRLTRNSITLVAGKRYRFKGKYRSSVVTRMYTNGTSEQIVFLISTSGAYSGFNTQYTIITGSSFNFYLTGTGYLEVDEFEIKEVLYP